MPKHQNSAAALRFIRKVSGFRQPSARDAEAVEDVQLVWTGQPVAAG